MRFPTAAPLLLFVAALRQADAAGNQEVVLEENIGPLPEQNPNRTSYQCTYRNLWTKERHPKNYPDLARWAGPIMWTHTLQFEPWREGDATTRGVEKLAEEGFSDTLLQEMEQQGEQVMDSSENPDLGFFVAQKDFIHLPPLETNYLFPYMSTMAGMDPSPDWYTGFYSFWLVDEYTRTWYDHLKIQTYAWDAGTDAGPTYDSLESDLDPPIPVMRFVPGNAPEGGELRSPDGNEVPVVAEWECFLVVGDEDMVMPDCDWFANPCCNETDKQNCGATLPNGSPAKISEEYAEVLANSENAPETSSSDIRQISLALAMGISACVALSQMFL